MHGTIIGVNIEGIEFRCPMDVDANITVDSWDNNVEPNGAGPGSISSVKKIPGVSGLTLRVDSTELGFLRGWSDAADWVEFFMTLRDGSVWGCQGLLKLDDASTAKGTVAITVQCQNGWDIQAA